MEGTEHSEFRFYFMIGLSAKKCTRPNKGLDNMYALSFLSF